MGYPVFDATTPAAGGGLYSAYVCIQDQKAANTGGGTFTLGAWRTRDLNTEVADTDNIASVSSNQITLDAGTYDCYISATAFGVAQNKARLYDTTGTADLLIGTSEYSAIVYRADGASKITGRFTIAVQSVLEVQHYSLATKATDGFGVLSNIDSKVEVYVSVEFLKVRT